MDLVVVGQVYKMNMITLCSEHVVFNFMTRERDPHVSLFDESSASFSPSQANDGRRLLELSHNGYRAHSRIMQTCAASHSMIYFNPDTRASEMLQW